MSGTSVRMVCIRMFVTKVSLARTYCESAARDEHCGGNCTEVLTGPGLGLDFLDRGKYHCSDRKSDRKVSSSQRDHR